MLSLVTFGYTYWFFSSIQIASIVFIRVGLGVCMLLAACCYLLVRVSCIPMWENLAPVKISNGDLKSKIKKLIPQVNNAALLERKRAVWVHEPHWQKAEKQTTRTTGRILIIPLAVSLVASSSCYLFNPAFGALAVLCYGLSAFTRHAPTSRIPFRQGLVLAAFSWTWKRLPAGL